MCIRTFGICRTGVMLLGVTLSACASTPLRPTFSPTNPAEITTTETLYSGSTLMRRVNGIACESGRRKEGEPTANAKALVLIKEDAASLGATGIYKLRFREQGLISKCFFRRGVRATGIAFHRT